MYLYEFLQTLEKDVEVQIQFNERVQPADSKDSYIYSAGTHKVQVWRNALCRFHDEAFPIAECVLKSTTSITSKPSWVVRLTDPRTALTLKLELYAGMYEGGKTYIK